MPESERIGFIGLGDMGGPIALRLLRCGFPMTVLDLDEEQMKPFLAEGARFASAPSEVAQVSDIVMASLHAHAVEGVVLGDRGIIQGGRKGLVFVDFSSTAPELAKKTSASLRERGIEMLDAPLSGSSVGARNGRLTIFVGGDYETYKRCLPILQVVGRMVTYLGESGNGQVAKEINQLMLSINQLAIYEGMLLAKKMDLDLKMFARAVSAGCAQSWWLEDLIDHVFLQGDRKYRIRAYPGGAGDALRAGKSMGLSLPGAEAAHQTFSNLGWNIFIDFKD